MPPGHYTASPTILLHYFCYPTLLVDTLHSIRVIRVIRVVRVIRVIRVIRV